MAKKVLVSLLNEKEISNLTLKQKISLELLKKYCDEFCNNNHRYEASLFMKDLAELYKEKILPEEIISGIVFTTLDYSKGKYPNQSKKVYGALAEYLDRYEKSFNKIKT